MDLSKNKIPDKVNTIHLIAICGTGMGALACMLKDLGYDVTGSDQKVYPPMSDFLSQKNIKFFNGFNENNLSHDPDLVIIGNAVTKDNPESVHTINKGYCFCSMPQALNHFVADKKKSIVVAGTHGKTTVSSLLSWVLYEAGFDPCFMIGGILKNFNSNYRIGKGDYIIIEGDEYDSAFFDKVPKIFHYNPFITLLTSIEFDHADIFKDIEHIKDAFRKFLNNHSMQSHIFAFDCDDNIKQLVKYEDNSKCSKEFYGIKKESEWQVANIIVDSSWNCFDVFKHGKLFGNFKIKMPGRHNVLNALSVIATANKLGISIDVIKKALETFKGIKRRQEIVGEKNGVIVMDDFAHHPSAVKETIEAIKSFYNQHRIIAVFEPRTNSSMRKVFQQIYPLSFDSADLICVREPSMLFKIPIQDRFSADMLVNDIKDRGKNAFYFKDTESIIDFLSIEAKPKDLVLIMSNGGFDNIHKRLLEKL